MPALREKIQFPQPLREVLLVAQENRAAAGPKLASHLEREAYERGRRDGDRAAQAELDRLRADLAGLKSGLIARLNQVLPQVVRECEEILVAMAVEVARKLVAGLPISVEMVEAGVREALAQAEEGSELRVYLNPEDLAVLEQADSVLLRDRRGADKVSFLSSAEVSRGGCLVRTRFGVIDTSRETKLELLKQSLAA
jgi:flagellar assembly protein FliH